MIDEIKPVYRCKVFEDADWIYLEKFPKERESFLIIETLYPAAAYEALSGKYHELKARSEIDSRTFEALQKELAHWKANHADLKERLHVATHRTDLPSDRLPLFDKMKAESAAQAKRIAELEDQLSSFPIPTAVAMQKIGKLRSEGFKEYAATVLNKENQYCIVGDYGDVRWSSKNGE